jgi:hypothetical protein
MACRGVHFALRPDEVAALRARAGDRERLEFVQEQIEEPFFHHQRERLVETDKAWDAIHRLLTDGTLDYDIAAYPLGHVILGGDHLYRGSDYIMVLKTPDEVRAVDAVIRPITKAEFRDRYFALDPDEYDGDIGEDDFEYTWEWFSRLREFWKATAERGLHVLFTVDQ